MRRAPHIVAVLALVLLARSPLLTLVRDWWTLPEAGHGLLLAPLALYLAWKRGIAPNAHSQRVLGITLLMGAVLLRYLSGLAAELFTMRLSVLGLAVALVVYAYGVRQLLHWWLPTTLLLLSIPLPAVVIGTLALPLQFKATQIGAALLQLRNVPVAMAGNVLQLPGHTLFVTEACSGLRSLTALIALGVLTGGLWLHYPISRMVLVFLAIPVAILLNGVRVFITGFLTFFVDPKLAQGFMHMTEGWAIFVVAFSILGAFAWIIDRGERQWRSRRMAP